MSSSSFGTEEFTKAVIERLGQSPQKLTPVNYVGEALLTLNTTVAPTIPAKKDRVGVDVFVHWLGVPDTLGTDLCVLNGDGLKLTMISNRGVKVWPDGFPRRAAPTTGVAASRRWCPASPSP